MKKNRIDKKSYDRLPLTHVVFMFYLLMQGLIQYLISKLDLPPNILIIRPNYYILSGIFILEIYLICVILQYVRIIKS